MHYDKKYLVWALGYAVAGMLLGIYMAASNNHGQHVTHAHILLVGFVVSLAYGTIHRLWLNDETPRLAQSQFIAHHAGAITLFVGLLILYGEALPAEQIEPLLAIASLVVLSAMVMMLYMAIRTLQSEKGIGERRHFDRRAGQRAHPI